MSDYEYKRFEFLHDDRSLRAWALEQSLEFASGHRFSDPDNIVRYVKGEAEEKPKLAVVQ